MNYHFIFGILAAASSVTAICFYVSSILRHETKPNRATWIIWNITNIILLTSYFSVGARATIFLPVVYFINALIVLFLSFRYAVSSWSRLDFLTIFIAGCSLLVWFITKNPLTALLMNLTMDASGYLPTIKKAYIEPSSESRLAWSLIFLGTCFNLFAINHFSFGIIIYPIVMFSMNGIMIGTLLYRRNISKNP